MRLRDAARTFRELTVVAEVAETFDVDGECPRLLATSATVKAISIFRAFQYSDSRPYEIRLPKEGLRVSVCRPFDAFDAMDYGLRRALNRLFARELAEVDISPAEFMLLWTCSQSRNSAVSQKQLASITGASPAQISQTAEQLRERGWIVLIRCSTDRRRQSLELTPQGGVKLQLACERLNLPAEKLIRDSSCQSHAEIVAFLRQLAPSIQEVSTQRVAPSHRADSERKEAA